MPKLFQPALAAGLLAFATPAFAAPGDPPLALVPPDQRLTLLKILVDAKPLVQVVMAVLVLALAAAFALWFVQLARIGRGRRDGAGPAVSVLSGIGAAGPLIGLFGAAYGLLDSFIGIANVRPAPSISILASGLAEAGLCVCLGLLAAAVAVIGQQHLKACLAAPETAARPAPLAPAAG